MDTLGLLIYLFCMAIRGFKLLVSKNMVTLGLLFFNTLGLEERPVGRP